MGLVDTFDKHTDINPESEQSGGLFMGMNFPQDNPSQPIYSTMDKFFD